LKDIGVVGAKLVYRTGRLEHIGIVLGVKGLVGYPLRGFYTHPMGFPDPKKNFVRNCSAVSGACMMVRKNVFEQVRGFDEQSPDACDDIDFCLRARQAGYPIVWTPDAELYHEEAPLRFRMSGEGAKFLRDRRGKLLEVDPYYNRNLTVRYEEWTES
jgi:GT2 family glycosyltransferase